MAKRRRQDSLRASGLATNSSKEIGRLRVHIPPGERKSGMPHSVEIPAPVKGTMIDAAAIMSPSRSTPLRMSEAMTTVLEDCTTDPFLQVLGEITFGSYIPPHRPAPSKIGEACAVHAACSPFIPFAPQSGPPMRWRRIKTKKNGYDGKNGHDGKRSQAGARTRRDRCASGKLQSHSGEIQTRPRGIFRDHDGKCALRQRLATHS